MYYEPYKRRGRAPEERERRGGCLPRALWFLLKLAFRLAVLAVILAVIAYALPPGLFNVEAAGRSGYRLGSAGLAGEHTGAGAWTPIRAADGARTR